MELAYFRSLFDAKWQVDISLLLTYRMRGPDDNPEIFLCELERGQQARLSDVRVAAGGAKAIHPVIEPVFERMNSQVNAGVTGRCPFHQQVSARGRIEIFELFCQRCDEQRRAGHLLDINAFTAVALGAP